MPRKKDEEKRRKHSKSRSRGRRSSHSSRRYSNRRKDRSRSRSQRKSRHHHSRSHTSAEEQMKRFVELYGPMGYQYYYYAYQYYSPKGRAPKDFPPMMPYNYPYAMKQQFAGAEPAKEPEAMDSEKVEGRESAQRSEERNEETDVAAAVREELSAECILKGVAISNCHIGDKLMEALNKLTQLHDPDRIDSILKSKQ
eukprot:TRINITY_DN3944_c0_g1_i18.p1 TRINITY_DN3944_c0_g1~~TRINITY_DN3944_c0_g1_i18.p1  ORF type:complete len:197 (+),score=31.02 TRINITY_DN3944_c0_g1_i18:128-718(+)